MGLLPSYAQISGKIWVQGREILGLSAAELLKIRGGAVSMIFQEPMAALDPVYTSGEQIAETIIQHEGCSKAAAWKRALGLLEQVKIPSAERRLKNFPHEMSGGMRQRAMIALALACKPSVLLADEPTTALDVTVQIQILLLLRQLQEELGRAIVFVTHDVGAAAEISDRIAVMYAGRFVETGTTRQVMRNPMHPVYTQGFAVFDGAWRHAWTAAGDHTREPAKPGASAARLSVCAALPLRCRRMPARRDSSSHE